MAAIASMATLTRSRWDTLVVGFYLFLTGGVGFKVLLPLLRSTELTGVRYPLLLLCIVVGLGAVALAAAARRLDAPVATTGSPS